MTTNKPGTRIASLSLGGVTHSERPAWRITAQAELVSVYVWHHAIHSYRSGLGTSPARFVIVHAETTNGFM